MLIRNLKNKEKSVGDVQRRMVLMLLQIFLPLGLFAAMAQEMMIVSWVIAAFYALSMVLLIWKG